MQPGDPDPDDDAEGDLDRLAPGWQPLLERPGYERWWDGVDWRGRPHKEPDPFSAFTPDLARSLRPGPNRAARLARAGIIATIAGFALQTLTSTGAVALPAIDPLVVTLAALAVAAIIAVLTAVAAVLALRAAPRLGGRAISTLALGVSIILGLAPVLLLVAIGLAGGV